MSRAVLGGRPLTTFAVGFLLLDAVLFALAGFWTGRTILYVGAGLSALFTIIPIVAWRRYRRALAEVDAARLAMKADVESLRDLLKQAHLDN
jgi:hypothetical protein